MRLLLWLPYCFIKTIFIANQKNQIYCRPSVIQPIVYFSIFKSVQITTVVRITESYLLLAYSFFANLLWDGVEGETVSSIALASSSFKHFDTHTPHPPL